MKTEIKYILFDVANTLIHKPSLWEILQKILIDAGFIVSKEKLQIHHKILSEQIDFPDRTNKDFYTNFNAKLLLSLGIFPEEDLLDNIFNKCSYLPWEPFNDTSFLVQTKLPIGILSNFRKELPYLLGNMFNLNFSDIIVSEEINLRKPDIHFFEHAVKKIGLMPQEILYIGDSFILDYVPARKININSLLIDRIGLYCSSDYIINDLKQLNDFIK